MCMLFFSVSTNTVEGPRHVIIGSQHHLPVRLYAVQERQTKSFVFVFKNIVLQVCLDL